LLVVDRASGSAWPQSHLLPLGRQIPDISFRDDLLGQQLDLAAGGRPRSCRACASSAAISSRVRPTDAETREQV
jgi:hypothetical protein